MSQKLSFQNSPHVYFDELHLLKRSLLPLSTNTSYPDPKLLIRFVVGARFGFFLFSFVLCQRFLPVSVGVFRLLRQLEVTVGQLKQLSFSDSDLDEILQLVSPDRLYVLTLTYVVSFLHALFAGLAFKNEVSFWRNSHDLYGMSRRSVIGNAICSIIIFLFLLDSPGTSAIIIATTGISAAIDVWKTTRVRRRKNKVGENKSDHFVFFFFFKILGLSGPRRDFSEAEAQTNAIDKAGMRYLWYILWPVLIGWTG